MTIKFYSHGSPHNVLRITALSSLFIQHGYVMPRFHAIDLEYPKHKLQLYHYKVITISPDFLCLVLRRSCAARITPLTRGSTVAGSESAHAHVSYHEAYLLNPPRTRTKYTSTSHPVNFMLSLSPAASRDGSA